MSDETKQQGSKLEQPPYGHERILLVPTRSKKGAHRLERQVFAEKGFTTFWVEDAKDWVSWRGEYVAIEVLVTSTLGTRRGSSWLTGARP